MMDRETQIHWCAFGALMFGFLNSMLLIAVVIAACRAETR